MAHQTASPAATVSFSVKGQVVIPKALRQKHRIAAGTQALVYDEDDRIVIKPLPADPIKRLRGSLKGVDALKVLMDERRREREK